MLVTDHPFHTLLFLFDQISSQADQFLKVSKYLGLCNKMDFAPKQRKSRQDDKHNKFENSSVVVKIHNNQHCDHCWDCGKIVQKKNICSSHGISMIGVWGRVGPTLIALGGRSLNQWGLSAAGENWTKMWSDQCPMPNASHQTGFQSGERRRSKLAKSEKAPGVSHENFLCCKAILFLSPFYIGGLRKRDWYGGYAFLSAIFYLPLFIRQVCWVNRI